MNIIKKTITILFVMFVSFSKGQSNILKYPNIHGDSITVIFDYSCYKYKHFDKFLDGLIYGNPVFVTDRKVLDKNKNLISLKTTNELGYTYYDWDSLGQKKFEEIYFYNIPFLQKTYFIKGNTTIEKTLKTDAKYHQIKYFEDSLNKIEFIRLSYNKVDADSIIKNEKLEIDSSLVYEKDYFVCLEIAFNNLGKVICSTYCLESLNDLKLRSFNFGVLHKYESKK
jgi:hypothetical protein